MKFLDNLTNSKQVEKLEREKKRLLENIEEDFEQNKRSFQDEQKSENKRSLLPVVNINTGKREDRFEELKTRELQDLESESESEDEGIPTEEKDLTIEEIKKLQNEQLGQW